jgi:uncharacterized RDD family membrane protein YckC
MARYGGFWIRFVAYIIDSVILNVAVYVISLVLGLAIGLQMQMMESAPETIAAIGGLIGGLFGLLASWLYFAVLEASSLQATLGKKALGLIVTDEFGERIGFGRATGRYFAKIISSIILLFGFFMIGWTERKRGLHDMIAGTLVYKASSGQDVSTSAAVFE